MDIRLRRISLLAGTGLALAALALQPAIAQAKDVDPPGRVARLAFIAGDVSFAPNGEDSWNEAGLNRPLIAGDRLLAGDGARVALDTGGAGEIRVDGNSAFKILRLDDRNTQIELSKGSLSWNVGAVGRGDNDEIDTPTLAFVATQPGAYRIDVAADGGATTISLLGGAGTVYGQDGASYPLSGRQSWRFADPRLRDIAGTPLAAADDFDRWCNSRDQRLRRGASARYVSAEVVGYSDLDLYGDWDSVDDYGPVWYPSAVAVGWAPYRYGHWAWIAPWGWTWIDDAPWGFAPFHYGRWIYVRERWGWVPGPRHERPVYCPALVAFVGGGWGVSVATGGPIGWVPLGPRDVYVPWYRGSRGYFTNVNVSNTTIINRTQVTNVYNNVQVNRVSNVTYMHQSVPGATTVVARDTFAHGREVNGAQVNVDHAELAQARPMRHDELPSGRPGLGLQPATAALRDAPSAVFTRPPITHREPPMTAPAIAGRAPERERPAADNNASERPRADAMHRAPSTLPLDRRPQPVPAPDELPSAHYAPRADNPAMAPVPRRENPSLSTPRGDPAAMPRPERQSPRPAPQPLPSRNPAGDAQRPHPPPHEEPRRGPEEHTVPQPRNLPSQNEREPRQRRQPEARERSQRERD